MSARKCAVCAKDPAKGFASVWWGGREVWYCHPDEGASCFVAVNQSVGRPLRPVNRMNRSAGAAESSDAS